MVELIDEPEIKLSDATRNALQEFLREKETIESELATLKKSAENRFQRVKMDLFKEDWQLSQFWYTRETADFLGRYLLASSTCAAGDGEHCSVCISAPSAYVAYKNMPSNNEEGTMRDVYVLEFDARFDVFDGFVKYDYKEPLNLGDRLSRNCANVILADPPFLSEECLVKTCLTVRYLAADHAKIVFCTGAVMGDTLKRLIPQMEECTFRPEHKSGLSNEFRCFSNFQDENFKWA